MSYILSDSPYGFEARRLKVLEETYDMDSIKRIDAAGIDAEMRCLEVGAGHGSIAKWMSERSACVDAVDLDVRFVEGLASQSLVVKQHDITQPVGVEKYDLIHCRFVLVHIPLFQIALGNMINALKPGGTLVLEEPDFTPSGAVDHEDTAIAHFFNAVRAALKESKGHPYIGRQLPAILQRYGLQDIRAEGAVSLTAGGSSMAEMHIMTMMQIKDKLLATGQVSESEFEEFIRLRNNPEHWVMDMSTVCVTAKKPAYTD